VLFIMATTERHKVPETILSRCQIFDFRLIAESKIFERLRQIAGEEGITIGDTALHKIARAGEGSLRDAQSVFDQVISFAGCEISDEDVITALGIVETEVLVDFTEAIADQDSPRILKLVDQLVERGYDLRYFCRELMTHFRNLLVLKTVGYDSELVPFGRAEVERFKALLDRFSEGELIRAFHVLTEIEQNIRHSTEPRFQLEIGLVKLAQAGQLKSLATLVSRVEALEKRLSGSPISGREPEVIADRSGYEVTRQPAPSLPRPTQKDSESATGRRSSPGRPDRIEQAATGVAMAPVAESKTLVDEIKAALSDRGKMLLSATLDQAQSIELIDDTLRITFSGNAKLLKETLTERPNVQLIEAVAREITRRDIKLVVWVSDGSVAQKNSEDLERDRLRAEAENDPTVKALLKTFQGEITEVVPKKRKGG
jgi:DNA polymerase-3 subunit gamma/tau